MRQLWVLTLLAVFVCCGCTHHLAFVEESHLALKAQFKVQSAAPYEIDLGYRRGMMALIPLQSVEDDSEDAAATV